MEKKNLTKEQIKEQLLSLSGIKKDTLNENKSVTSTNSSTLLYYKKAADGKVYGIIKENHKYFVKVSPLIKEQYNVYDFAYIGGLSRKMDESYKSYADATNRLHTKLIVLKEAWTGKTVKEDEIPLNKDVDTKKSEEAPEDVEVDNTETEIDATADKGEAPATTDTETMDTTSADVNVDTEKTPETDTVDVDLETPTEPEASADDISTTDTDKDDEQTDVDNVEKEIQSLLGKLSAAYQQKGEVTPSEAKSAINTIISSTKSGIQQMGEPEKDELIKRIEKDGEKLDENEEEDVEVELSDDELNEAISFLEGLNKKEKLSKTLNKIIKEELENYKKEKEAEIVLENLTEDELEEMLKEFDMDSTEMNEYDIIDEIDCETIEESLKNIQEQSEKLATDYINKKTEGKTLNEVALADLTKKAKAMFNKKAVEDLVNSDPKLKSSVDTVKKAVDAYNNGDPSMFEKLKSTGKKGLTTVLIILSLLGNIVPSLADANPTAIEDLKDKVELVDTKSGDPQVATFQKGSPESKTIDFQDSFTSDSDSIDVNKENEIVSAYNNFIEKYNVNPKDTLTISVGTDQQRSRAFESNQELAKARAASLTKILRKNGVTNPIKYDFSGVNGGSSWDGNKFAELLKTDKNAAMQYQTQWRSENQPARFVKVSVEGMKPASATVKLIPTTYNLDINLRNQNSDRFRETVKKLKELGGSEIPFSISSNYVTGKTVEGEISVDQLNNIIKLIESNKDLFDNSEKVLTQLKSLLSKGGEMNRTADTQGNVM